MQTFQLLIDQLVLGINLSQQGERGKKNPEEGGFRISQKLQGVWKPLKSADMICEHKQSLLKVTDDR